MGACRMLILAAADWASARRDAYEDASARLGGRLCQLVGNRRDAREKDASLAREGCPRLLPPQTDTSRGALEAEVAAFLSRVPRTRA